MRLSAFAVFVTQRFVRELLQNGLHNCALPNDTACKRVQMGKWTVNELLELFRGSFTLHTRSYEIKGRPLRNQSQFAVLFKFIKDELQNVYTANKTSVSTSLVPIGYRNADAHTWYSTLTAKNRPYTPPDPSFVPPRPQKRVHLATLGEQQNTYVHVHWC